tara:strand:- start:1814 stop:1930 length:117 start_codon:yes stop_codon:yes gene_type:complete
MSEAKGEANFEGNLRNKLNAKFERIGAGIFQLTSNNLI